MKSEQRIQAMLKGLLIRYKEADGIFDICDELKIKIDTLRWVLHEEVIESDKDNKVSKP